jgi:general secretion pathway protein A
MYARHYGLRQEPFSIAPDPRYLFMSERHREALAHLLYGLQSGGGFVLLTGEIGAGKTTVCRAFLEQVPEHCHVACIFNPQLTVEELLQTVCEEFGVEVAQAGLKARVDALNAHLLSVHAAGGISVLVIDEAQSLAPEVLEQLRLLTNLETSERKLLQIVLIGQPELRSLLARPELEQLAQRIIARFHLGPLSEADAGHYIHHRLAVAGLQGALPFDSAARKRIHALTGGVPRRINLLCDRALLGGYSRGVTRIGPALVEQAAREVFDRDTPTGRQRWQRVGGVSALGVLVAAVGWGLWSLSHRPDQRADPASAAAAAAVAVSSPTPSAAADTVGDVLRWPAEPVAEQAQLRNLATLWGATLDEGEPCEAARLHLLQCFRRPSFTLAEMRQLGRPGVVTLRDGAGAAHAALITALGEDRITLQLDASPQTLRLASFAQVWQGDYATLWRTPPGETPASPAWLDEQLARLAGGEAGAGTPLAARILAFQRASGLEADGVAGPMTLMQLNRAMGVDEPRLAPTAQAVTPP